MARDTASLVVAPQRSDTPARAGATSGSAFSGWRRSATGAIGETAVAIGLVFGVFSNLTYLVGTVLAAVIWTTAEGFGGPYTAGSTDIGAAVIYVIVFAGLFISAAGMYLGIDRRLRERMPARLRWLTSTP